MSVRIKSKVKAQEFLGVGRIIHSGGVESFDPNITGAFDFFSPLLFCVSVKSFGELFLGERHPEGCEAGFFNIFYQTVVIFFLFVRYFEFRCRFLRVCRTGGVFLTAWV